MRMTIKVYRRETVEPPATGSRWMPDGTLSGEIVLEINEAKLAQLLGPRALKSNAKKSILAGGAIVARAVDLVRDPEAQ